MSGEVLLTAADGVIRNSSCVGGDCPNTPTFSDTTMLMMENNTRIKFDDTSSAASFPRNDWEIEANSSSNGGLSYLGINDCGQSTQGGCATDLVFAVEAGAPQSALYVEDSGDVGLGTSNPILELHVVDGDSPSLRLQQDGSSGFTPQIWDLAGNETNFFLRDATNGSTLPFRVEPGAETSLLHLTDDDHVGIGTGSASARLHVRDGDVDEVALLESRGNSTRFRVLNTNDTSCPAGSDCSWSVGGRQSSNFFITRDGTGTDECTLTPSGNFSCIGTVSGSSSRTLKSDILPVDPRRMLTRVLSLPITEWTYTRELADGVRHVSPIAEDFYDTFGLGYDEKLLARRRRGRCRPRRHPGPASDRRREGRSSRRAAGRERAQGRRTDGARRAPRAARSAAPVALVCRAREHAGSAVSRPCEPGLTALLEEIRYSGVTKWMPRAPTSL